MLNLIEVTRPIRFSTLEARSGRSLEDWIADWNDEHDPAVVTGAGRLEIGDLCYVAIRYKCPGCGRWNHVLTFEDPSGAIAVCEFCLEASEH